MYKYFQDEKYVHILCTREGFSEEDLADLRDRHKIFHNGSCVPIMVIPKFGENYVVIGTEDDGHLKFNIQEEPGTTFLAHWTDSLISNLQDMQKYYNGQGKDKI